MNARVDEIITNSTLRRHDVCLSTVVPQAEACAVSFLSHILVQQNTCLTKRLRGNFPSLEGSPPPSPEILHRAPVTTKGARLHLFSNLTAAHWGKLMKRNDW